MEPGGFERLVKYIRVTEAPLGDGVKKVYESEKGFTEEAAPREWGRLTTNYQ